MQRGSSAATLLSGGEGPGRCFLKQRVDHEGATTCRWVSTIRPRYQTFDIELGRGDLLVFYTDVLSEAADRRGKLLGRTGCWRPCAAWTSPTPVPARLARHFWRPSLAIADIASAEDDVTLVVLHHNALPTPRLSLGQKVDVYAKVFGLKSF